MGDYNIFVERVGFNNGNVSGGNTDWNLQSFTLPNKTIYKLRIHVNGAEIKGLKINDNYYFGAIKISDYLYEVYMSSEYIRKAKTNNIETQQSSPYISYKSLDSTHNANIMHIECHYLIDNPTDCDYIIKNS